MLIEFSQNSLFPNRKLPCSDHLSEPAFAPHIKWYWYLGQIFSKISCIYGKSAGQWHTFSGIFSFRSILSQMFIDIGFLLQPSN